jgi:phage shock protein PspC (stress-responsive transcriptional regulator)
MLSGMVADLARHFGDNRLVIRTLFRRKALLMFLILLYIEVAGLYFATNMAVIMIFATMIPTAIFYFATAWLFSHAENLLKQCGNAGNSDVTQTSE